MKQFSTPILIIIFNRPHSTQRVYDVIRKLKPTNLYVAADGPRQGIEDDIEKCNAVRNIFDRIDWNCELKTSFSNHNLGCGRGPSEAITWFFGHVQEGIILEDDSLPHLDFFLYCHELLEYYRNNYLIKTIGSANFQNGVKHGNGAYYFSMQNGAFCSWATWKRTWDEFDYYLNNISIQEFKHTLKYYKLTLKEYIYWIDIFNNVKKNRYQDSCWDYQLMFSIWKSKGLGIVPNVNLSTNVGFSNEASHTFDPNHPGANKPSESIMPLIHPTNINANRKADVFYHNYYYQPKLKGLQKVFFIICIANKWIKSWFNINQSWKMFIKNLYWNVYTRTASIKSQIKNNLFWRKQARVLRSNILHYFSNIPGNQISNEEKEVLDYLKLNKLSLLPYNFAKKYSNQIVDIHFDEDVKLNYVVFQEKKLYFKRSWSSKRIRKYFRNLLAEQDPNSPHRYLTKDFNITAGDIVIDAGAAEGLFSLEVIEKVQKVYIIEPDSEWVNALSATFSPWEDKVVIIDKYISGQNCNNSITLDDYFLDQHIDFIKIDVEGSENVLLEGSEKILNRNQSLKLVIATYHRQNDEITFMQHFLKKGFEGYYSKGFIPFYYDIEIRPPFFRRCLIRAYK